MLLLLVLKLLFIFCQQPSQLIRATLAENHIFFLVSAISTAWWCHFLSLGGGFFSVLRFLFYKKNGDLGVLIWGLSFYKTFVLCSFICFVNFHHRGVLFRLQTHLLVWSHLSLFIIPFIWLALVGFHLHFFPRYFGNGGLAGQMAWYGMVGRLSRLLLFLVRYFFLDGKEIT